MLAGICDWCSVLIFFQVTYAACDAMAAVLIFIAMVRMKVMTSESSDYSVIAAKAKSLCQGIIDLKYSGKTSDNHSSSERVSNLSVFGTLPFSKLFQYFFVFKNKFDPCRYCCKFQIF